MSTICGGEEITYTSMPMHPEEPYRIAYPPMAKPSQPWIPSAPHLVTDKQIRGNTGHTLPKWWQVWK